MDKRYIILAVVVAVGVVLGLGVVNMQYKNPLMREMFEAQQEILKAQKGLEQKMGGGEDGQGAAKIEALEKRILSLESQWKALQVALKQIQNDGQADQAPNDEYTKVQEIPVAHSPVIGKQGAPVTITEFVDFQCPFCARFHGPIVEVLKAYPDKVNYLVKNFPLSFHPQAKPGSKAALAAAEQGKFQEMVDAILADNGNLNDAKFRELATKIGLDMRKFEQDLKEKDEIWEQYIKEDILLGNRIGVRGTPTFFINGRKTIARDFESLKQEVEDILSGK